MTKANELTPEEAVQQLEDLVQRLPVDSEQLRRALQERLIQRCSAADLARLGLEPPPQIPLPMLLSSQTTQEKLLSVQGYISHLRYNYAPGYHFNVSKKRPFVQIMRTAKTMIHAQLPIKCIEAVFLGMFCTAGWANVDRWTLSFKTTANEQTYRHIVLVVFDRRSLKFGALGISRQATLMFKDLIFDSLMDLVQDFREGYSDLGHVVRRISFSLPVEHDVHSPGFVGWNSCMIDQNTLNSNSLASTLEAYLQQLPMLLQKFKARGIVPRFGLKARR